MRWEPTPFFFRLSDEPKDLTMMGSTSLGDERKLKSVKKCDVDSGPVKSPKIEVAAMINKAGLAVPPKS